MDSNIFNQYGLRKYESIPRSLQNNVTFDV